MIRHRAVLSSRDIKGIGLILWDKPGNIAMTAFEKDFFRDLSRDQEGHLQCLALVQEQGQTIVFATFVSQQIKHRHRRNGCMVRMQGYL